MALSNQALLDNAYEGLISLDQQRRIRAYNQSAQRILGIPAGTWCLGLDIEDTLHSPQIAAFASGKEHTAEEIIEYHNTQISFRRVSVLLRGEVVGNVLTFLNAAQIQESEEKLRGKLYAKRNVLMEKTASGREAMAAGRADIPPATIPRPANASTRMCWAGPRRRSRKS